MAARATARIEPLKLRRFDSDLHADVLSVVGYRYVCGCGKAGARQPSYEAARAALVNHRAECDTQAAPVPDAAA